MYQIQMARFLLRIMLKLLEVKGHILEIYLLKQETLNMQQLKWLMIQELVLPWKTLHLNGLVLHINPMVYF